MKEFAGYLKDLRFGSNGAILGVQRKSTLIEIETSNRTQIKLGRKHLLEFEVLSENEGEKAYLEWVKKNETKEVIISGGIRKPGRPIKK